MMRISESGKEFIKKHEGLRLVRYPDAGGKDTIGYGHLILASDVIGTNITQQQADMMLSSDLMWAEKAVNDGILIALNQNEFDALVSFVFNVGSGAFSKGTLRNLINSRQPSAAIYNWWTTHYITAGGKELEGLKTRRKEEAEMFRYGLKKKFSSPSLAQSSSQEFAL